MMPTILKIAEGNTHHQLSDWLISLIMMIWCIWLVDITNYDNMMHLIGYSPSSSSEPIAMASAVAQSICLPSSTFFNRDFWNVFIRWGCNSNDEGTFTDFVPIFWRMSASTPRFDWLISLIMLIGESWLDNQHGTVIYPQNFFMLTFWRMSAS